MKVSLVLPAWNEAGCLRRLIPEVARLGFHEVILVDGNSTDGTLEIAKEAGWIAFVQPGRGYGDAVRAGHARATGDVVAMLDADGSQDPADFPAMLAKLAEGYDIVIGTRYARGGATFDDTPVRALGNWFFTRLYNLLYGQRITDSLYLQCVFRRTLLERFSCRADDFSLCIELTVRAVRSGARMAETPCRERARFDGASKVHALLDGWKILRFMLGLRFER